MLVIGPLAIAVVLSVAAFVGFDALLKHGQQPSQALLLCGTLLTALSLQIAISGTHWVGSRLTGLPWHRKGFGYGQIWNGPKRNGFLLWIAAMVGIAFLAASQARGPENEPPAVFALLILIVAVGWSIWARRARKEIVGNNEPPIVPSDVRKKLLWIAARLALGPFTIAWLCLAAAYFFGTRQSSTLGYVCIIVAVSFMPLLLRLAASVAVDYESFRGSIKKA